MDLYEFQAKDLFAAHGVPVLPGRTVETADDAAAVAADVTRWQPRSRRIAGASSGASVWRS